MMISNITKKKKSHITFTIKLITLKLDIIRKSTGQLNLLICLVSHHSQFGKSKAALALRITTVQPEPNQIQQNTQTKGESKLKENLNIQYFFEYICSYKYCFHGRIRVMIVVCPDTKEEDGNIISRIGCNCTHERKGLLKLINIYSQEPLVISFTKCNPKRLARFAC